MFKIQDNPDGSTSIYCKNSGNLLCTIPPKKNSNGPRRVNVVEPQPVNVAGSSWHRFRTPLHPSDELVHPKDESLDNFTTRESKCCISPIPITPDGDQAEDYFEDCITQDEFSKCLNLISSERLHSENRQVLLAEYPLRLLSRSKAYRTLEDCPTEDLRDIKIPDYMPLTSDLGIRILRLNEGRNFIGSQKVQISVKKYDSYCRFPFNAPKPSDCHFPKLRCREKKQYPICTSAKILRHDSNHVYTHGRRQRYERILTMKTGLDARSRRLLRLCNTKKCQVKLKRLTASEIASWKKKRNLSQAGTPNLIQQNQWVYFIPARSILNVPSLPSSSFWTLNSLKQKYKCNRESVVLLANVINFIHKRSDGYYVRGTSIRIPFYTDFLKLVETRKSLINTDMTKSVLSPSISSDHAYHRTFSKERAQSVPLKPRTADCDHLASPYCRSSSERNVGDAVVDGKVIPVIDLTGDTTPPKKESSHKNIASHWQFRCFACGFERVYWNNSTPTRETDVDLLMRDHLQVYHAVLDPDLFISRYTDLKNRCIIVEAFPGYKGNYHE